MTIAEQTDLLMQGTDYGDAGLRQSMETELSERLSEARREGRPLRVYCGFDPRTADLHLGHTVPIRKLRQFQDLGHEVSFVVGTGTALIGDPSDKTGLRPILGRDQALANGRTYAEQAFRILDRRLTNVRFNHEWLDALTLQDLIRLGSQFSVQQFLARDNFHARLAAGEPVWLHETFYSLLQGYDALTLKADVQVGGTDQIFNIVTASRRVMTALGCRANVALIVGILPGTDGKVKMSKSLGNHIPLRSGPDDMYGLVMSIPDDAMRAYFTRLTRLTPGQIDAALGGHPMDAKRMLAREIVSIFHSSADAEKADAAFLRVHSLREAPEEPQRVRLAFPIPLVSALVEAGLARSKTEARRLLAQGGVRLEGQVQSDPERILASPCLVQVGRRRFVRMIR